MAADKWLIVGLGNPGPVYSHNRHNVGYWCGHRPATGEGSIRGTPVLLAKPRTFMNRSGQAVAALLRSFKVQRSRVLVVCDDLDLPIGALRLKAGGGAGGQKGIASIIAAIGGQDFPRLRIGIGRPAVNGEPTWDPDAVAAYVLSDPTPQEAEALPATVAPAAGAVGPLR